MSDETRSIERCPDCGEPYFNEAMHSPYCTPDPRSSSTGTPAPLCECGHPKHAGKCRVRVWAQRCECDEYRPVAPPSRDASEPAPVAKRFRDLVAETMTPEAQARAAERTAAMLSREGPDEFARLHHVIDMAGQHATNTGYANLHHDVKKAREFVSGLEDALPEDAPTPEPWPNAIREFSDDAIRAVGMGWAGRPENEAHVICALVEEVLRLRPDARAGRSLLAALETVGASRALAIALTGDLDGSVWHVASFRGLDVQVSDATRALAAELQRVTG